MEVRIVGGMRPEPGIVGRGEAMRRSRRLDLRGLLLDGAQIITRLEQFVRLHGSHSLALAQFAFHLRVLGRVGNHREQLNGRYLDVLLVQTHRALQVAELASDVL